MTREPPPTDFILRLMAANGLGAKGKIRWLFFEGMLFGSMQKWWGAPGRRLFSHEGLDLCFFETESSRRRLDESVQVPVLYDGRVAHITDDFLGRTVVFRHRFPDGGSLLSLYGHLAPDKNLRIGDGLRAGEIFARIAEIFSAKKRLVPHLHISLANPEGLPPAEGLEWEFLNTVDRRVFFDPLAAIQTDHRVLVYDRARNLSEEFIPVSVAQATDARHAG